MSTTTTETTATDATQQAVAAQAADEAGKNTAEATKTETAKAAETEADKITRLERELADARQDAGKARTNAKETAATEARDKLVKELGKALGLVKDDTPVDPKELQAQIAQLGTKTTGLETSLAAADVRHAALLAAYAQGVNLTALMDSNSFLSALNGLDPKDATKIKAAIDAAVKANPSLMAQAARRSGPEFTGGPGDTKPKTLEDAIAAKLGGNG